MLYFLIVIHKVHATHFQGFLDVYEDITDIADTKGVSQPKSETEYLLWSTSSSSETYLSSTITYLFSLRLSGIIVKITVDSRYFGLQGTV